MEAPLFCIQVSISSFTTNRLQEILSIISIISIHRSIFGDRRRGSFDYLFARVSHVNFSGHFATKLRCLFNCLIVQSSKEGLKHHVLRMSHFHR